MLRVEKISLIRFLIIYVLSMLIFTVLGFSFYYDKQSQQIHRDYRNKVDNLKRELQHQKIDINLLIDKAHNMEFKISIFQDGKAYGDKQIMPPKRRGISIYNDTFYFMSKIPNYLLKNAMFVLSTDGYKNDLLILKNSILSEFIFSLPLIGLIAYILGMVFLNPIRQNNQRVSNFIKDITHEMSTPLATILMSLETLKITQILESEKVKIERIKIASLTLSNLYDDLKLINFPEKYPIKNDKINLKELINDRIKYFIPLSKIKQIDFTLDVPSSVYITNDTKRLSTIIDNIISNAIKYNNTNGYINISFKNKKLTIKDNGIGIEETKLKHIFKRFYTKDIQNAGFGIGLDLVKKLCDEMGIHIDVVSKKEKGTTFVLSFKMD